MLSFLSQYVKVKKWSTMISHIINNSALLKKNKKTLLGEIHMIFIDILQYQISTASYMKILIFKLQNYVQNFA